MRTSSATQFSNKPFPPFLSDLLYYCLPCEIIFEFRFSQHVSISNIEYSLRIQTSLLPPSYRAPTADE
jgi:hypothetical protein